MIEYRMVPVLNKSRTGILSDAFDYVCFEQQKLIPALR